MADELDLDMDEVERALAAAEGTIQGSSEAGPPPPPDAPMAPDRTEALLNSPGRPSESYDPDLPNWALETSNAKRKPGSGLACVTCPEAVWMSGAEELQAFCRVLRAMTWSTREVAPILIEVCNGKEMAIIAIEEAKAREDTTDYSPPSR